MTSKTKTRSTNSSEKAFVTEWFTIDKVPYGSSSKPYYRLSCNDSVVIIALTPKNKMILVRQFRPAIGVDTFEWPAGEMESVESPEIAIQRELREETGYACDSIKYMGCYRVSPCRINTKVHTFLGTGAKKIEERKEKQIEVILVNHREFKKLIIENGKFVTLPTMGLYYLSQLKGFLKI